jgi:type I restriction enzyme S subunit
MKAEAVRQLMPNVRIGRPALVPPPGWQSVQLHDVVDVRVSTVDKHTRKDHVPVRLCNYMDVWTRRVIREDHEYMRSTASPQEVARFALRPGDVLLTKDSETREEIAETAFVEEAGSDLVLGYHCALLRPRADRVDGLFLANLLRHPTIRQQFVKAAQGASRYGLTLEVLRDAVVWLPPLDEQRRIARLQALTHQELEILGASSDCLKAFKRGLMQELLTGRRRFPEFRTDPWPSRRIEEIAQVNPESLTDSTPLGQFFRYIDISAISAGKVRLPDGSMSFGDAPSRARRIVRKGDVLFSTVRPYLQGFAIVESQVPDLVCSTGFAVIRLADEVDGRFMLEALFSESVSRQTQARLVGSSYPALNEGDVRNIRIPWPSALERQKIASILTTIRRQIDILEDLKQGHSRLKHGLMQKLLSGDIEVPERLGTDG